MSGSDDEAIRKRVDRLARAEARKARLARQEAREAAELAEKRAEQERLVAEAKAARERGEMVAPKPPAARTGLAGSGQGGDVSAVLGRLERRQRRAEEDQTAVERVRGANRAVLGERTVDDPLEPGAKLRAVVNLAEHPLERMLARQRLDHAQYEAGVRFRLLYEKAAIGPGRAIDPAKIKVDGGQLGDPLTDAVIHAHRELARIIPMLGKRGSHIAIAVCGQGVSISELAARYDGYENAKQNVAFINLRLKEALDVLAEEVWGAKGPQHGRICGERGLGGEAYDEQAVEVANQSYLRRRGLSL